MQVKLAEALLRRKELAEKVRVLSQLNLPKMFEPVVRRVNVTESVDQLEAQVPKLTASQVTAEYDWHAKQLRQIDAAIQQANWTCEIEVTHDNMSGYDDRTATKDES